MGFKKVVSAFTLIELLVVIVVIGMMSSLSIATYNNYVSNTKVSAIKQTVNDLYRFTVLYAREKDMFYDEIVLSDIFNKFKVEDLGYGDITYVALGKVDFYYQATLPSGETWTVSFVPKVYAENSSFYARGTSKGMDFFKSLDDRIRGKFIRAASDDYVLLHELKPEALRAGFNSIRILSLQSESLPDLDKDGVPDYRDDCPRTTGLVDNKGCPLVDTDGDGVTDDKDQCPEVAGDEYAWGCVIENNNNITIKLISYGAKKINVIKAVRAVTGLGLKESKNIIDTIPSVLKNGISQSEAEEIKNKIETAGGAVDYKSSQEVSGGNDGEVDNGEAENIIIKLTSAGKKKINVIKAIRAVTGLGLKEAKNIAETVPSVIKRGVTQSEAEEIKNKIEAAGGAVDYKSSQEVSGGNDGEVDNRGDKNITIIMTSYGAKKISGIKVIRKILGLGLKEAKYFVENLPRVIKKDISEDEALEIKNKIEVAGGSVDYN